MYFRYVHFLPAMWIQFQQPLKYVFQTINNKTRKQKKPSFTLHHPPAVHNIALLLLSLSDFFQFNSSGPPWNALRKLLVSSVLYYKKLIFASWTAPSRGLDGIPCSVSFSNSNKSTTMSPVDKNCLTESSWGLTKAPPPTASPSSSPIGLLDGEAVWG